jgi:hypothetical protein
MRPEPPFENVPVPVDLQRAGRKEFQSHETTEVGVLGLVNDCHSSTLPSQSLEK